MSVDVEPAVWFARGNQQASERLRAALAHPLEEGRRLLAPSLQLARLAVLALVGMSLPFALALAASDDHCCVLPGQAPAELWARCLRAGLVGECRVGSRSLQPLNLLHCLYQALYRQGG